MIKLIARALEFHETPEGITIPLYRDYDLKGNVDAVRMAYVTTVNPGMTKGPIVHSKRRSMVMAIGGEGEIEYADPDSGPDDPRWAFPMVDQAGRSLVIEIPPLVPVMYKNFDPDSAVAYIILTDYAWRPNDGESTKYVSWEDYFARR